MSGLRKLLGEDTLRHTPAGYVLDRRRDRRRPLRGARRGGARGHPARTRSPRSQLLSELWRGDAYDDAGDGPLVRPSGPGCSELRVSHGRGVPGCGARSGRHREVAERAAALVAAHPLRERLTEVLMLALYRSGRRDAAARAYAALPDALADELDVAPSPAVTALADAMRRQDPTLDYHPVGLPAPTSRFVGRRAELDALDDLVAAHRLVTLVGPGGVGKTRLAIQLCRERVGTEVFWVELAASAAPDSVLPRIAEAIGVREALRRARRTRRRPARSTARHARPRQLRARDRRLPRGGVDAAGALPRAAGPRDQPRGAQPRRRGGLARCRTVAVR